MLLRPAHASCQVLPPREGASAVPAAPAPDWLEAALYAQHPRGSSFVFDNVVVRPWASAAATGVVATDARYAWHVDAGRAAVRVVDGVTGEAMLQSPDAVLADWRNRGLRASARADLRWREKCVGGRHVPSPELRCDAPGWE